MAIAKFGIPVDCSIDPLTSDSFHSYLIENLSYIFDQKAESDDGQTLFAAYKKVEFTLFVSPKEVSIQGEYGKLFDQLLERVGSKLVTVSTKIKRVGRFNTELRYSE